MAELVVVGFHGKRRAAEALDELQRLSDDWAIELQEGVAVYRRDNGKLRMEASVNPTENEGAGIGGALGLLVGVILAEHAWDWKGRFGIPDEFVRSVAKMIQPGDSAVFALLSAHDPGAVVRHFATDGGTVLRTTIGSTDTELLQPSR